MKTLPTLSPLRPLAGSAWLASLSAFLVPTALGQVDATLQQEASAPPVTAADEVRPSEALLNTYMEHVDFLASEFLEGRLPGTPGMEIAKDYMQYYFERAGLQPAYQKPAEGQNPWRQPFELAGRHKLDGVQLSLQGQTPMQVEEQFCNPGWGALGEVEGALVFTGYALEKAPDDADALQDYQGFPENVDLTGKVAMLLRFEPMNEEGRSAFGARRWSSASGVGGKLRALEKRGASAILMVNTPGAADARVKRLRHRESWSGKQVDVPVFLISGEAAQALLDGVGAEVTLGDLIGQANQGGVVQEFGGTVQVQAKGTYDATIAENVIGVLPGKGALKDEVVIIGGHLDHLGRGGFGSRASNEERGKVVHPGADDNASGCAALILLAESLKAAYEALPADRPARSIVFIAFSAEESGLNGAAFYTEEPVYPLADTSLMINFDMIGRIENRRFSASGLSTGKGLLEFVQGLQDRSPLEIKATPGVMPASDHWRFVQKDVPIVFASMDNIHDDYHTPRDTSAMIQPLEAVWATEFVHEMAYEAGIRAEKFEFQEPERQGRRSPNAARVVFGVQIGGAVEGGGVRFSSVTNGSSAGRAGVKGGDILIKWAGETVENANSWRAQLAKMKPDEEVTFTIRRGEQEIEMKTKMDGR